MPGHRAGRTNWLSRRCDSRAPNRFHARPPGRANERILALPPRWFLTCFHARPPGRANEQMIVVEKDRENTCFHARPPGRANEPHWMVKVLSALCRFHARPPGRANEPGDSGALQALRGPVSMPGHRAGRTNRCFANTCKCTKYNPICERPASKQRSGKQKPVGHHTAHTKITARQQLAPLRVLMPPKRITLPLASGQPTYVFNEPSAAD